MIDILGVPKINMARYMETLWAIDVFGQRAVRKRELAERQRASKNFRDFGETLKEIRLIDSLVGQLKREVGLA